MLYRADAPDRAVDPRAVQAAVTTVLSRLVEQTPVLLAVDDAQWVDASSAATVAGAARHAPKRQPEDGNALYANARDLATADHVYVGTSDMTALVMRYVKDKVTIKVGESVTFDANLNTIPVPHTVTFGVEPPRPYMAVGDPTAFSGGNLASGVLFPSMFHIPGTRSTFTVTFTAPGTYSYRCAFHDGMGMAGQVVVLP